MIVTLALLLAFVCFVAALFGASGRLIPAGLSLLTLAFLIPHLPLPIP